MTTYFVTRHPGALEWAAGEGVVVDRGPRYAPYQSGGAGLHPGRTLSAFECGSAAGMARPGVVGDRSARLWRTAGGISGDSRRCSI